MKKEDILYPIEWESNLVDILYREIFEDGVYNRIFEVKDGDVVLDLGANIGLYSLFVSEKANISKVYMVEPLMINFDYMVRNVIYNKPDDIDKFIFIKAAISEDGYSTIAGDIGAALGQGTEKTKTFSFMSFIDFYGIDKIDVLKLDIEGSELKMFNDETFYYIENNINRVCGELHPIMKYGREIYDILKRFVDMGYDVKLHSVDGIDITDRIFQNKRLNNGILALDFYEQYLFSAQKNN